MEHAWAGVCMQEVSSVAFSPDNKYLAAQGGAPEWNLVLWSWEKSKALANVRTSNLAAATVRQVEEPLRTAEQGLLS